MQRTMAGSKRQMDGKRGVHWRLLHVPSRPRHGLSGSMPRQPLPVAALGQPGGDGGRRQWQRDGGGGQKRGIHFLALWSIGGKILVRYGSWIAGRVLRRAAKKEKLMKHLPIVAGFAAVGSATYIAYHVEEVPFSGRMRIQSLPPDALHKVSDSQAACTCPRPPTITLCETVHLCLSISLSLPLSLSLPPSLLPPPPLSLTHTRMTWTFCR